MVLIIDDCQWAPGPLLDALAELADYLDRDPRAAAVRGPSDLLDRRPDWGSGRLNATSMALPGLTVEDALLLSSELVEVSAHDGRHLLERIIDRAEGNPLHLEQLFASLDRRTAAGGPLPPTVYALLAARIDARRAENRLTLDLASIIGREFSAAGLRALAGAADPTGESQSGPTLRELTRRRLIEPLRGRVCAAGAGRATGSPAGLIQEVAYKGMAKRVRSEPARAVRGCLAAGQARPRQSAATWSGPTGTGPSSGAPTPAPISCASRQPAGLARLAPARWPMPTCAGRRPAQPRGRPARSGRADLAAVAQQRAARHRIAMGGVRTAWH